MKLNAVLFSLILTTNAFAQKETNFAVKFGLFVSTLQIALPGTVGVSMPTIFGGPKTPSERYMQSTAFALGIIMLGWAAQDFSKLTDDEKEIKDQAINKIRAMSKVAKFQINSPHMLVSTDSTFLTAASLLDCEGCDDTQRSYLLAQAFENQDLGEHNTQKNQGITQNIIEAKKFF